MIDLPPWLMLWSIVLTWWLAVWGLSILLKMLHRRAKQWEERERQAQLEDDRLSAGDH